MRTDGLYAHKVRSQQGGCETALLRYFKQVKGEQPFEQCGFTDDMDCQSCPDLGLKWGVSGFLCLGRLFQGQPNEAALCI